MGAPAPGQRDRKAHRRARSSGEGEARGGGREQQTPQQCPRSATKSPICEREASVCTRGTGDGGGRAQTKTCRRNRTPSQIGQGGQSNRAGRGGVTAKGRTRGERKRSDALEVGAHEEGRRVSRSRECAPK